MKNKKITLEEYLEKTIRVNKLKEQSAKYEEYLEHLNGIEDEDDLLLGDRVAELYNDFNLKNILVKIKINDLERDLLSFELEQAVSD